jgi:MOSC domain-containing protein YiiM
MPDIQPSILSIEAGKVAPLGASGVLSGFVKRIVRAPVKIVPLCLTGDEQADFSVHGGPDKTVYFYPSEHYATWTREFPEHRELLARGGFGENLTTAGLIENTVAIGDVFSVGNALLQVTQPRQPCFKLAIPFDDPRLGRAMLRSGGMPASLRQVRWPPAKR